MKRNYSCIACEWLINLSGIVSDFRLVAKILLYFLEGITEDKENNLFEAIHKVGKFQLHFPK